jgi:PKD repeat protein
VTVTVPALPAAFASATYVTATGSGGVAGSVLTTTLDCVPVEDPSFTTEPLTPYYGEVITFTAAVAAGSEPITYTWDFGDDSPAVQGAVVAHAYALETGLLPPTVRITATNACGLDFADYPLALRAHTVYLPVALRQ